MITTLVAAGTALAFNGRCLTLESGRTEECRQYFGQPKAAVTVLKNDCKDSKWQKTRKRRWSDTDKCGPAVVGTCRIKEGTTPEAAVTERVYMRPTEDSTEAKCLGLKSATMAVEWIPVDR